MRQGEAVVVEDDVVHEQQIEIESAWAFHGHLSAIAAKFALDGEESVEQFDWWQAGLKRDSGIQEMRLVGITNRLCLIKGGLGCDRAQRAQAGYGGDQCGS